MMNIDALKNEAVAHCLKIALLVVILVFLALFHNSLSQLRDCLLAFIKMNSNYINSTILSEMKTE